MWAYNKYLRQMIFIDSLPPGVCNIKSTVFKNTL